MDDKINYFKRELMNYVHYKNVLTEINLKLHMIALEIKGVSSPNLNDPIIENKTYQSPINKFELLEDERFYLNKKIEFESKIKNIDDFIETLSPDLQRVVMGIYILNDEKNKIKTYTTFAKELNYSSTGLKKILNKKIVGYIKSKKII